MNVYARRAGHWSRALTLIAAAACGDEPATKGSLIRAWIKPATVTKTVKLRK